MLADGYPGTSRINQADGFVRQLTRGNVTVRQTSSGFQRFIEQMDVVMLFQDWSETSNHQDRLVFARLVHLDHLKTARQRGIFLKVFLVLGPVVAAIVRRVPRAKAGLSRFAASPWPAAPPAPIRVCASSIKRMIGFGDACTSSMTCAADSRTPLSCWHPPAANLDPRFAGLPL